jgi:poly(A) polymerase
MTRLDPARESWMHSPATVRLTAVLPEARFVGGAVRNALMARAVEDIDIAIPLPPDAVCARLAAAGIKCVPTGITHGTVTAVVDGKPFEITSLRRDVATDGRHAEVAFGTDWEADSRRRDFTMNALYAAFDGEVFDYHGGRADLAAGRLRFVGDPARRIAEDYLRILRLFRFHAWYGKGDIEPAALAAAAAAREGIRKLSGERIAKEMLKLLSAPDLLPVLRPMARSGILAEVLLGDRRFAELASLAAIDARNGLQPDAILRLAVLEPDIARIAERWKLSNLQRKRLEEIAELGRDVPHDLPLLETRRMVYRLSHERFNDKVFLSWLEDGDPARDKDFRLLLERADHYALPRFPLGGEDVAAAGVPPGPLTGKVLAAVEEWWVDNDFSTDKFALASALSRAIKTLAAK